MESLRPRRWITLDGTAELLRHRTRPAGRRTPVSPTAPPVSLPLLALAAAVVAGAVLAVSVRDGRLAVVGLLAALLLSPIVADPLPDLLGLAARLVGGVLAAYLIRIPLRSAPLTGGSRIGWPAESVLAGAAFLAGIALHDFATPGLGPAAAVAAGLGVAVVAAAPLTDGRDPLRVGIAAVLFVVAADLVSVGLGGTESALRELIIAVLVGLLGAVIAGLAARGAGAGPGPETIDGRRRSRSRP